MSVKKLSDNGFRTWIEIDAKRAQGNYDAFRKIIEPGKKIWVVVKSNAYGHGVVVFSKLLDRFGVDGFCVDSAVEGFTLRRVGIKKPILVFGPTLPTLIQKSGEKKLILTVPSFDALKAMRAVKNPPDFHIKVDTGMHRQGFYPAELPKVIRQIQNSEIKNHLKGVYTHFAAANDLSHLESVKQQFSEFQNAMGKFDNAGFMGIMKHCAATGAALMDKKYHLDGVRIGLGCYGLWPSRELEQRFGPTMKLRPVLSWRTVVSDVKNIGAGEYVGYDLTERVKENGKIAILPIGYWHGMPGSLSRGGEVLIRGKRAKVLGRVSMDLLTVGVSHIPCRSGDIVTLIGKSGPAEISAEELAKRSGTSSYELVTRLNPLMERIIIG